MVLRVGVSQIQNSADIQQNLRAILSGISKNQLADSDLVIFPECALTGFTSLIKDSSFHEVAQALKAIQNLVNQGTTAALVPTTLGIENGLLVMIRWFIKTT